MMDSAERGEEENKNKCGRNAVREGLKQRPQPFSRHKPVKCPIYFFLTDQPLINKKIK